MIKPFYWDKDDCGTELESCLHSIKSVDKLFVATAFLSCGGVDILQRLIEQFGIEKKNITICLSADFSEEQPSEILARLVKISNVRIAKEGRFFHPKFYYLQSDAEKLLIFGSSNLTSGGFGRNIEFDMIYAPNETEIAYLEDFMKYCISKSDAVTGAYIQYYKSIEGELRILKDIKSDIAKKCSEVKKQGDPFTKHSYDLSDFYFNFEDYETFFPRNCSIYSPELDCRRKIVQKKLLKIHDRIGKQVQAFNLHAHWDKSNITSLTRPCIYNRNKVDWMGVRYGKRKEEIMFGGEAKSSYESFTKHACLQCNVYATGFQVVLFFAVPEDAVDRKYLKDNLGRLADEINRQAKLLKGHGLVWEISDSPSFHFDTDDDLAGYLKKYDCDGRFSSLNMYFAPDDLRIKTLDGICDEVLKGFKLLNPLYNVVAWRAKR